MNVKEFFEMVCFNEYHNIRLKSDKTDLVITEFSKITDNVDEELLNAKIKNFATDWYKKIYILWI